MGCWRCVCAWLYALHMLQLLFYMAKNIQWEISSKKIQDRENCNYFTTVPSRLDVKTDCAKHVHSEEKDLSKSGPVVKWQQKSVHLTGDNSFTIPSSKSLIRYCFNLGNACPQQLQRSGEALTMRKTWLCCSESLLCWPSCWCGTHKLQNRLPCPVSGHLCMTSLLSHTVYVWLTSYCLTHLEINPVKCYCLIHLQGFFSACPFI